MSSSFSINLKLDKPAEDFFRITDNNKTSIDSDLFFLKDEDSIKTELQSSKNVKIRRVNITENQNYKNFDIDVLYDSKFELPNILLSKYIKNTIYKEKGILFVKTVINTGLLGEENNIKNKYSLLTGQMKETIDAYSSIINISLVYTGPTEITKSTSAKKGVYSNQNKTIEYTYSLTDILQSKVPIEIITQFKK